MTNQEIEKVAKEFIDNIRFLTDRKDKIEWAVDYFNDVRNQALEEGAELARTFKQNKDNIDYGCNTSEWEGMSCCTEDIASAIRALKSNPKEKENANKTNSKTL